jgi:hypothetical protein
MNQQARDVMPQRNDTLPNLPFIHIEAAPLPGTGSGAPRAGLWP